MKNILGGLYEIDKLFGYSRRVEYIRLRTISRATYFRRLDRIPDTVIRVVLRILSFSVRLLFFILPNNDVYDEQPTGLRSTKNTKEKNPPINRSVEFRSSALHSQFSKCYIRDGGVSILLQRESKIKINKSLFQRM